MRHLSIEHILGLISLFSASVMLGLVSNGGFDQPAILITITGSLG